MNAVDILNQIFKPIYPFKCHTEPVAYVIQKRSKSVLCSNLIGTCSNLQEVSQSVNQSCCNCSVFEIHYALFNFLNLYKGLFSVLFQL